MAKLIKTIGTSQLSKGELLEFTQEVRGNADQTVVDLASLNNTGGFSAPKSVYLENVSNTVLAISWHLQSYTSDTMGSGNAYPQMFLAAGDWMYLPTTRMIDHADLDLSEGTLKGDTVPDASLKVATAETITTGTGSIINDDTNTKVYLSTFTNTTRNGTYRFRLGDYIQIASEIMRVVEIGDGSDIDNTYLIVERGVAGSTASASHADGDDIYYPFFNDYADYDKIAYASTDSGGRYKANNFFGLGRKDRSGTNGILPGSVYIKMVDELGYQELGVANMNDNTDSGLTAGDTYYFKITADGTSPSTNEVSFTVDSSVTTLGGSNGVLAKMNEAIKLAQSTDSHDLLDKNVSVSIINGDIRFTSHTRLSTSTINSTITLGAGASGADADHNLFAKQNGVFPSIGMADNNRIARKSNTYLYNTIYESTPNLSGVIYDNGKGELISGSIVVGTINYETGAFNMETSYYNSSFTYNCMHSSGMSGSINPQTTESSEKNSIIEINARCTNPYLYGKLKIRIDN